RLAAARGKAATFAGDRPARARAHDLWRLEHRLAIRTSRIALHPRVIAPVYHIHGAERQPPDAARRARLEEDVDVMIARGVEGAVICMANLLAADYERGVAAERDAPTAGAARDLQH